MDFDGEDGPPLLVDIEAKEDDSLEEPKPVKVPITIVTGKSSSTSSSNGIDTEDQDTWEPVKPP
jgi:hypothetical protein